MMMTGALFFAPFLERHLGLPAHSFPVSVPATYVVHRDSQLGSENICAYLRTVHALISEAVGPRKHAYFGRDLAGALRPWSPAAREVELDPALAIAAVSTPEIAINPKVLAELLRNCIAAQPNI